MMAAQTRARAAAGALWPGRPSRTLLGLVVAALLAFGVAYQSPLAATLGTPGIVLSGLYDVEGRSTASPYRWSNADAHIWLIGIGRQAYHVSITLSSARPAGVDLPRVTLLANGAPLGTFSAARPVRDYTFDIPADAIGASGDVDLNIKSDTFAPPNDLRALGVALYTLRIEPAGAPPVVPAPAPLVWGALAAAFLFLGCRVLLPRRAAWAIAAAFVLVVVAGLALARLQTVELLPWAVLVAVVVFVIAQGRARGATVHPNAPDSNTEPSATRVRK